MAGQLYEKMRLEKIGFSFNVSYRGYSVRHGGLLIVAEHNEKALPRSRQRAAEVANTGKALEAARGYAARLGLNPYLSVQAIIERASQLAGMAGEAAKLLRELQRDGAAASLELGIMRIQQTIAENG